MNSPRRTQEFLAAPSVKLDRVYRIRTTDAFGREISTTVFGWEHAAEMLWILREQGHVCRLAEETWVQ